MNLSRLASALSAGAHALVFLLAFALSCLAIRAVVPFPDVPVIHTKLEHLSRHVNEYDTLFIGSSRIYRHVVPSIFDRLMAGKGVATRSFNAGIDGMRPPEDAYLMDRIFAFRPKNLRYVFLELGGMRVNLDEDKKGTIRSVYWHDWERLTLLFERAIYQRKKRDLPDLVRELREPLALFAGHVELFAQNMANVGRGETVMTFLGRNRSKVPDRLAIGDMKDGYIAANLPQEMPTEARSDYEHQLAERKRKPAAADLSDPISQKALERMVAKIEQIGATPILIVPPTTNKKNFMPSAELVRRVRVLDFSDIGRYPELYENRYRQDTNHVNAAGAEVFTRLLAGEFAPIATQR